MTRNENMNVQSDSTALVYPCRSKEPAAFVRRVHYQSKEFAPSVAKCSLHTRAEVFHSTASDHHPYLEI